MGDIINIFPTSEELITISNCVSCSECNMTFRSKSNLTLHFTKTHQRSKLEKLNPLHLKLYHCPESKCSYNVFSKPFRSYKLLKQHYLKVHAAKQIGCITCGKCFPVRNSYYNHLPYCGIIFNCNSCPAIYDCYETLKTHARRKCHLIDAKTAFNKMPQLPNISKSDIIPKILRSTNFLPKHGLTTTGSDEIFILSKSSQTDFKQHSTRIVLPRIEVQEDKIRFAETQTIGDYQLKKSNSFEQSFDKKTQTRKIMSCTKSSNTSLLLSGDGDVDIVNDMPKVSTHSSTQTNMQILSEHITPSLPVPASSSTTNDLTAGLCADDDDTLFFNMETQTDCTTLISDMLDGDYYSNMYTQTCNDIFNEDLGLNNICTQTTILDDDDLLLRSVESQTTMSHSSGSFTMSRDCNHMETQTDAEFKELLDAINA